VTDDETKDEQMSGEQLAMDVGGPTGLEKGAPWRFVNRHGVTRLYEVDRTELGPPGVAVFLKCLEKPHEPVEGYKGGESREARILLNSGFRKRSSLGEAGWLEGHE